MRHCEHCLAFIKKGKLASKIDLSMSFTKINGVLHLGFNRPQVCPTLASYIPDTVILAGNGAVEMKGGGDCWTILKKELANAGLLGPADEGKYQDELDALTWIAAHCDFFGKTIKPEAAQKLILGIKTKVIRSLHHCPTSPREMHCSACIKQLPVLDSQKLLILTTNWDLGLFNHFANVIQLHGRCDYPEQAVLPLQNISALMAQSLPDLEKLNCGILPGPFLQQCLEGAGYFVFWGTRLNIYDAALWHFLRGFLKANAKNVQLGIAARNAESCKKGKKLVERFFPSMPIQGCLCNMLSKK